MNQKYIMSPSSAMFRLLLLDIFMAVSLGVGNLNVTSNGDWFSVLFCILLIYFFILYFRYKLAFYFKAYLMNMYGATSISIADLAKNVSETQYTTRKMVKKIVDNKLLRGIVYEPDSDIFDIKAAINSEGRHFNLKISNTKQIRFPFVRSIFIANFSGILFLTAGISSIKTDSVDAVISFIIATILMLISLVSIYSHFDALRYMIKMAGLTRIPIQTLADHANTTLSTTYKSLQMYLQNGLLNNMIISQDNEYLTLPENILELLNEQVFSGPIIKTTKQTPHQDNSPEINKGRMYVKEIRKMNVEMPDEAISTRLDKLERITEQIFKFCEKNTTQNDIIRKFLDYHLPTTLKLVSTYKDMDSINSETQNIGSIKQEIIKSLDIIIKAFEQILDQLAENLRINVEGDISALKTILEQDGFINNDNFNIKEKKGK